MGNRTKNTVSPLQQALLDRLVAGELVPIVSVRVTTWRGLVTRGYARLVGDKIVADMRTLTPQEGPSKAKFRADRAKARAKARSENIAQAKREAQAECEAKAKRKAKAKAKYRDVYRAIYRAKAEAREPMILECSTCSLTFTYKGSGRPEKFCSDECRHPAMSTVKPKAPPLKVGHGCVECGAFRRDPRKRRCSSCISRRQLFYTRMATRAESSSAQDIRQSMASRLESLQILEVFHLEKRRLPCWRKWQPILTPESQLFCK